MWCTFFSYFFLARLFNKISVQEPNINLKHWLQCWWLKLLNQWISQWHMHIIFWFKPLNTRASFCPLQKGVVGPWKLCPAAAVAASFSCSKVLDSSGAVNFITSEKHFCSCRTVKWHLPGGFCAHAHLLCLSQLLIINALGPGLESPSYFHHWIMCEISAVCSEITPSHSDL